MDPEYQELLKRLLAIQADCEIGGPHLYVKEIMPAAPTKADQLMVAKTAAEELDHYRKIARLAGDVGEDVSYVLSWPNQKRYVEAFRGQITTWEDFAIFGFLIDRVGRYQLEEFMDCSYQPLAEMLPVVLKEEIRHVGYGGSKAAELMTKGDESRERLQNALNYWYVKALDMFGRAESKRSERYRFWGLKRRSNEQARQQYIAEVNPLIVKLGLQVPEVHQEDRLYH
jgi:ring-1,2-phenylacetyl-CoA epoxidase subunit PaaA